MNGLDVNKFKKFLFDMYNDIEVLVTPGHRIEKEKSVLSSYVFKIDEGKSVHFRSIVQYNEEEIKHISLTVFSNGCDESLRELFDKIEKRFVKELKDASEQGEAALDYINEFIDELFNIAPYKIAKSHKWKTENYTFEVFVAEGRIVLYMYLGNTCILEQNIIDYTGIPSEKAMKEDINNFFGFFFSNYSTSFTKDRNQLIDTIREKYSLDFSQYRPEYQQ